jgi:curved DNA-binding protein
MEFKDYYKILGVEKNATHAQIKAAFRKLARKHHPDVNPGDQAAEEKFKSINEAYEVLGDSNKRKKYDELGSNWEQILRDRETAQQYARPGYSWQTTEDFNLGDFFESFFGERHGTFGGDFRGGPTHRDAAGQDVESEIELTLEELVGGGKRQIRLSIPGICGKCGGRGMVAAAGAGKGRSVRMMQTCPSCHGQGQTLAVRDLAVKIPGGLTEGSRFRLVGQGGKGGAGSRSGDLYLRVKIRPHRVFRLEGYDLHAELPVLDDEAALGIKLRVPTLKGSVQLTVPPESTGGQSLRLKEQGLPRPGGTGAGDLYFHLTIYVPKHLTEAERRLYSELRRERSGREAGDALRKRLL